MQILEFHCSYAGGTFCYTYVGGSFCCSYEGDCFCCNYANISATNTRVAMLLKLYKWKSVAIMQVVFSTVYYPHDYFYYNYASGCFRCSHVCDNFKQQLYIPFSNWLPFFIKLTRKHLKTLYQVCISPLS